jgi:integrase
LLRDHAKKLLPEAVGIITPQNVTDTFTPLLNRAPAQARRALAMWERVFDFARKRGYRTWDNPAKWKGVQEYEFPPQPRGERKHHAKIEHGEMREFLRKLRTHRGTGPNALEFLILTATRNSEVCGARWEEFVGDVWTIPASRTKQRREHRIPLSTRAIALVESQREHSNGSPYVFTGYSQEPLAERTMYKLLREIDPHATVHGFRSSFRDWCGDETNAAEETAEQSLAHRAGDGVKIAYRRKDALAKRRVIMEEWAAYITKSPDNLI